MKELISPRTVESVMLWIAIAGPIVGLIIGALLGLRGSLKARTLGGLAIGLLGPVIFGAWRLYGAITDSLGLDSAANLLLQIVMFAILGPALGIAGFRISLALRRLSASK
jgi:hypothetical protein